MGKYEEDEHDISNMFNPFVFGTTFWKTLMTNWWYNVGRDFAMDPVKMSKYWYDAYMESLNEFFPVFDINNIRGKSQRKQANS